MGLNAPIMGYLSLSQTGAGSFLTYRMQHLAGKNDYLSALRGSAEILPCVPLALNKANCLFVPL